MMTPHRWTCEQVDTHLSAYLTQQLDEKDSNALFEHLLSCSRCFSRYRQLQTKDVSTEALSLLDEIVSEGRPQNTVLDEQVEGAFHVRVPTTAAPSSPWDARWDDFESATPHETTLEVIGTVLPPVPQPEVYRGYQLFLGEGLPQPSRSEASIARLQLESTPQQPSRWTVEALGSELWVNESRLAVGESMPLDGVVVLLCGTFCYRLQLSSGEDASVIWHKGPQFPLPMGETRVGRDPAQVSLLLPDRIASKQLLLRGTKSGNLSSLDAYNVSRAHARLTWNGKEGQLQGLKRIPVQVLRGSTHSSSSEGQPAISFESDDILQLGWQLFRVRGGNTAQAA
ncbi:MAG: zf-HC2 domain-containing protein [Myxococcota bacterium]